MEKDWPYHSKHCEKILNPTKSVESKLGKVGLYNLGNTCYMNSGLQCLSHTKALTKFLLNEDLENEMSTDNPLASKNCNLLRSFVGLVKQLHFGKKSVVAPRKFKTEMGQNHSMFMGVSQHDSQEFLSQLLDSLHEDLNLIKKKPYVEGIEGKIEDDDEVVARKSWIAFLKRNYSRIVNLFYAQFKSSLSCPVEGCGKVTITYDPYQLISLPIPKTEKKNLVVIL